MAIKMTRKTDSVIEGMDSKFLCHQNALLMAAINRGAIEDAEKLLADSGELASAVANVPCGRLQVTALQLAAAKGMKMYNMYITWSGILRK
jgi:hypothetical protein